MLLAYFFNFLLLKLVHVKLAVTAAADAAFYRNIASAEDLLLGVGAHTTAAYLAGGLTAEGTVLKAEVGHVTVVTFLLGALGLVPACENRFLKVKNVVFRCEIQCSLINLDFFTLGQEIFECFAMLFI